MILAYPSAYTILLGRRHRRRLLGLADTDFFTSLPNRRSVYRNCDGIDALGLLSVALLDLNRFKALNDQYGHAAGDEALKAFAAVARSAIRATDSIARWGGEEFLMLLPATTAEKTVEIIERIRQAIATIALKSAPGYMMAFSAGVASRSGTAVSLDALITAADAALYRAIAAGRDRTVVDVSTPSPDNPSTTSSAPKLLSGLTLSRIAIRVVKRACSRNPRSFWDNRIDTPIVRRELAVEHRHGQAVDERPGT